MKRIPHGKYSKEFREEAVKHVIEQGLSVPEASSRLDVPKSLLKVTATRKGGKGVF